METITSAKNEKLKNIAALLKSKKERDAQGRFVIEGLRLFNDTLKTAPRYIESVFYSESAKNTLGMETEKYTFSENMVKDSVFDAVSGTVTSQGIMAIVKKPLYSLEQMLATGKRFLVLENIQDPGNLGTMLRTAEAAGMDGIVMSPDCADIFSPKVVRSSMGSIFRLPFVYCEDFIAALKQIKDKGMTVYAAYLHGGVPYKDVGFDDKCAILIGNEGNGLTEKAVEAADKRVFIPMAGEIESLNAAVAAAILMYR